MLWGVELLNINIGSPCVLNTYLLTYLVRKIDLDLTRINYPESFPAETLTLGLGTYTEVLHHHFASFCSFDKLIIVFAMLCLNSTTKNQQQNPNSVWIIHYSFTFRRKDLLGTYLSTIGGKIKYLCSYLRSFDYVTDCIYLMDPCACL